MTLTDFLLARIAEDEEVARKAVVRLAFEPFRPWTLTAGSEFDMPGAVIAEPSRVLAECEAKRRIVAEWFDPTPDWEGDVHMTDDAARLFVLLALPYADHADYREEWKP